MMYVGNDYAVLESHPISIWQDLLLTFNRFIDDMFGIWIPDPPIHTLPINNTGKSL